MSAGSTAPDPSDVACVAGQLGRSPRGRWSVCARCSFGRPVVISVAPLLADGERFPTSGWLTCPWLVEAVARLESRGDAAAWTRRIASDEALRRAVLDADTAYRSWRRDLGGGEDPCGDVGVAGQADPRVVKCLHARVAAFLAGRPDPVGEGALADVEGADGSRECGDDRCRPGSAEVQEDVRR